ncbi:nitrous oxide reductase accessory protein NosL [Natronococcus occultus]|uniref:nitrous oxide reductase accessory protein NosL n=1 Tax=Natronococcus occultus TaxID=29288 RepID=UPI0012FB539B|nr:nitrous oxide reductase accessory protein NosL [Natronococcus occultus]
MTEDGHPIPDTAPSCTDGEDAWCIHGSDARTPSGETPVPFSERDDATAFADAHGGTVLTWDELLDEGTPRTVRFDHRSEPAADTSLYLPLSYITDTCQHFGDGRPANSQRRCVPARCPLWISSKRRWNESKRRRS